MCNKIYLFLGLFLALANAARIRRAPIEDAGGFVNLVQNTPFRLSKAMSKFNNNLFSSIAQDNNGNIVFSPFSLHTVLSMTVIGAPRKSETYEELANVLFDGDLEFKPDYLFNFYKVLSYYQTLDTDVKLKIANKAFASDTLKIKANYTDYLRTIFHSSLQRVNFQQNEDTANIINDFVEDATNGLIDEIVEPSSFSSDTKMVLVNAVYFKATWLNQFDPSNTKPMKFNLNDGKQIDLEKGMNMEATMFYGDITDLGLPAEVLELPYNNDDFRMLLILPTNSDLDIRNLDLEAVEQKLSRTKVKLTLPRFKIEYETKLNPALKRLGIDKIFNEAEADLHDISDEALHVSDVAHKAVIEVNEEGSEAAAVSSVQIDTRISDSRRVSMVFDRPFYFVIEDFKHRIPLFFGRISDPSGENEVGIRQAEVLQDCDPELGYTTNSEGSSKISLPCNGKETLAVREETNSEKPSEDQGSFQ